VPQPDGTRRAVDIRTLPFVRFDDNEAHTQRRHSVNLGGFSSDLKTDVAGVGPDAHHPFIIRNLKVWDAHWALHAGSPSVMVDGLDVHHVEYAIWRENYDHHAYRGVQLDDVSINRDFMPRGTQPAASDFPGQLAPLADLPPTTVITLALPQADGSLLVRGFNGGKRRCEARRRQRPRGPRTVKWLFSMGSDIRERLLARYARSARGRCRGNVEHRGHVVSVASRN